MKMEFECINQITELAKELRKLAERSITVLQLKRWCTKSKEAADILDRQAGENEMLKLSCEVHFTTNELLQAENEQLKKALEYAYCQLQNINTTRKALNKFEVNLELIEQALKGE